MNKTVNFSAVVGQPDIYISMNLDLYLISYKNYFRIDQRPNVRAKTIKPLEENKPINLNDHGSNNSFLDSQISHRRISNRRKMNKFRIKFKTFGIKNTCQKVKRSTEQEK